MNEKTRARITRHADSLIRFFELPKMTDEEKIKLCKKLRRIENITHKFAEDWCNTATYTEEQQENIINSLLKELDKILHFKEKKMPVFINTDPRGYALKIDDTTQETKDKIRDSGIYRDFGGYGIISPDLT